MTQEERTSALHRELVQTQRIVAILVKRLGGKVEIDEDEFHHVGRGKLTTEMGLQTNDKLVISYRERT